MRFMPNCRDVALAISRDQLASLSLWRRATLRWHLFRCRDCGCYAEQIRLIGRAVGELYGGESAAEASLEPLEARILKAAQETRDPDRPHP